VEYYYHGPDHPDLFAHRDPVQVYCGRWYFHRSRGVYRSGSFKGLDVSFGDGASHGGVLFRSLEAPDGTLIDGPSLLVDYLLRKPGYADVAALDSDIGRRLAWDESSPLTLRRTPPEDRPLLRTARVGLALKWSRPKSPGPRFVLRPYRFLSEPRRVSKGKVQTVLALYVQGKEPTTIQAMTGTPLKTVQRYTADFEAGRQAADFGPFFGKDLGPSDLCKLHGVWYAIWVQSAPAS